MLENETNQKDQVARAKAFLSKYGEPSQEGLNSYNLKPLLYDEIGYVYEESLVKAAQQLGFKVKYPEIGRPVIFVRKKGWDKVFNKTAFCEYIRKKARPRLPSKKDFIKDTRAYYYGKKNSYQSFRTWKNNPYKDFQNPEDFERKNFFACDDARKVCHSLYKNFKALSKKP